MDMPDEELSDLAVLAGLVAVEYVTLFTSVISSSSLNAGLPGGPYCWLLGRFDL